MRTLLLLIMVAGTQVLGAQQEQARFRAVAAAFQAAYNEGAYGKIFERFDSLMQAGLPLERTEELFGKQVRATAGQLRSLEFSRLQGPAHVYKATFDGAVLDLILSLDVRDRINGLYLRPHTPDSSDKAPVLERNTTPMALPFRGEWFVFWGGEDELTNYHMGNVNQQYAYDILKVANGSSHNGDPTRNENYYAFGQEILAPCDAEVVLAIDGVPDNIPGETNPIHMTGNTLVLKTPAGEFILMAHLKEGSLKVRKGQAVRRGEVLAQCGNSGNSTEAHLHLQLQNTRDFHKATGARLLFDRIRVNGQQKSDFMPVKEDFIANFEEK
ncbi:peptidoglycan DD-metalloendopeptidase family protein [Robiginitalea sp. M366]|uniref:peptidoglycan DD-metalloendopeptidase family protein n=1 Tax=Robiginitalea aestuariiviva TaxID=3036903 RepID=UPI00240D1B0B|nr:peptidoglycan DD-metalloendopeptidase family protein [Robiginitalea aestuariiviva]MDG1571068.1 peptidoglycan DD-metalloendopeptidase family protein [Robiginitalea aestuariiviva]